MIHLGDITKLNGAEIPVVDCVTFGAPCQDLSVAGLRAGMKSSLNGDEETTRSGLFFDAIRVMKEMRENDRANGRTGVMVRCRYGIYENVPGAFSSNGGRDFQTVLTALVRIAEPTAPDVPLPERGGWSKSGFLYDELGKWSVAWRSTDAQYNGTPQRRKRLCVLADFNGLTAGEILFDPQLERTAEDGQPLSTIGGSGRERGPEVPSQPEGLSGDSESRGTEREEATGATGGGVDEAGGGWRVHIDTGADRGLIKAEDDANGCQPLSFQERAGKTGGGKGLLIQHEKTGALQAESQQSVWSLQGNTIDRNAKQNGGGISENVSHTLNAVDRHGVAQIGVDVYNQEITGEVAASLTAASGGSNTSGPKIMSAGFSFGQSEKARGIGNEEEVSPTLRGGEGGNQKPVALIAAVDCRNGRENSEVNGTLQAKSTGGQSLNLNNVVRETKWENKP